MASVNQVRTTFLDYFRRHGHRVVPSSPLVPGNDPTLLFTNAGMVQFKDIFTGTEKRDFQRAVTAQKCVRAGGKHNDLDNVGYTARHHTFFEMLGNFSFGDYFKELAIELAWNLTTKEYGLSKERLLVTVHSSDEEAAALWRRIAGLPERRIVRIPTSDNFWSMGETGPCGPCSEIFIDQGPELAGGPPGSPDEAGDRFLEFWNLVFMQFEQRTPQQRVALPMPSIDTGMGLERMAAILQGVKSNFDTDLFRAIVAAAADAVGRPAEGEARPSFHVIADHLRAAAFLIADGVLPANEGRGYVLRRIMRRAMRHAHILGAAEPLMHRLVPVLVAAMGQAFPELRRGEALIVETLRLEESRFRETLERGLRLLADETAKLAQGADLPGEVAFRLWDTYGFPLDLTQDALRRQRRGVDRAGFEAAMAAQRARARAAWQGSGARATDGLWFGLRERVGASEFLGYDATKATGRIVALLRDGAEVEQAGEGDEVELVADRTPFYGEAGGQMGDAGDILLQDARIRIDDTRRECDDLHVHVGRVVAGAFAVGDEVRLAVDACRRRQLAASHSATHLLHTALRHRLGAHVVQKGSLVAPDRLRFDIAHSAALAADDLAAVEAEVNAAIRANHAVATRLTTPEEAVRQGALALFGETYSSEVRVVSMAGPRGEEAWSTELCGGTHVRRTGDIGAFKIVAEGAVAAGIRRVEALTGAAALAWLSEQDRRLRAAARRLKAAPADLEERIGTLLEERRAMERELAGLRRQLGAGGARPADDPREIAGVKVVARLLEGVHGRELRALADDARRQLASGIVVLVAVADGKAALVAAVTDDLTGRFDAVDLVRAGVASLGGRGGGGRRDMAQGGGSDADGAAAALERVLERVAACAAP